MDAFDARSLAELDRELRAKDVQVPGRTEGRQTKDVETWVACRFLATVARSGLLQFPVRVEHGERPDFVLSAKNGSVGIELTEAISPDQARVDAFVERDGKCGFRPVPRYRISDPKRSRSEIRALAQGKSQLLPRMGDSVERDWVEAMSEIVAHKAAVFVKPGFASYLANWLLVYDNWKPVALLDEAPATAKLCHQLSSGGWSYPFCKVFVQRPRAIWEFNGDPSCVGHWIPDSWLDR